MSKVIAIGVAVVGLFIVGYFFVTSFFNQQTAPLAVVDYKNSSYNIEGQGVLLSDGKATTQVAPGSASTVETAYFGNEARGDLNGDGREDVVFLLTQSPGGTGVFYYAVAALNTGTGYVGSDAYLLGDRIAPQTTEIREHGVIVVNYADRKPGEAMTAEPTVAKSAYIKLDPQTVRFGVVANDPGEANPASMKLTMKKWEWVSALFNDGRSISPQMPNRFSITFKEDGTFGATTDCNGLGGNYVADQNGKILFTQMISTKMFCEGSQEAAFVQLLETASGYHFTSRGELVLDLKFDSGSVVFK